MTDPIASHAPDGAPRPFRRIPLVEATRVPTISIDRTDSALGLIVGTRQTIRRLSDEQKALKYLAVGLTYGLAAMLPWSKTESNELEASVNVTAIDDGVRVRVALQRRTLDKNGWTEKSEALTEGILYQDLFEILGRSLFVGQGQ